MTRKKVKISIKRRNEILKGVVHALFIHHHALKARGDGAPWTFTIDPKALAAAAAPDEPLLTAKAIQVAMATPSGLSHLQKLLDRSAATGLTVRYGASKQGKAFTISQKPVKRFLRRRKPAEGENETVAAALAAALEDCGVVQIVDFSIKVEAYATDKGWGVTMVTTEGPRKIRTTFTTTPGDFESLERISMPSLNGRVVSAFEAHHKKTKEGVA